MDVGLPSLFMDGHLLFMFPFSVTVCLPGRLLGGFYPMSGLLENFGICWLTMDRSD